MACRIETNEAGVVNVFAENGRKSQLYKSLLKQSFTTSDQDALVYYEAALKYANDNVYKDSNGEPIIFYTSLSSTNQLALPNKTVYTTSYKEALEQDTENKGIEVGVLKINKPQEITEPRDGQDFFHQMRNTSLRSQTQVQGIGPNGTMVVTDPSTNNFRPITKLNKQAVQNNLQSFINELVTGNFISAEKIPATKLNEEETIIDFKVLDMGKGDISVLAMDGDQRAGVLRLIETENGIQVKDVKVYEGYQRQGIGQELYFTAIEELGTPILSDFYQSTEAKALWESLVRQGFAERTSNNQYKLTSYPQPPTIGKTPEQTVSELIASGEIEAHCKL